MTELEQRAKASPCPFCKSDAWEAVPGDADRSPIKVCTECGSFCIDENGQRRYVTSLHSVLLNMLHRMQVADKKLCTNGPQADNYRVSLAGFVTKTELIQLEAFLTQPFKDKS